MAKRFPAHIRGLIEVAENEGLTVEVSHKTHFRLTCKGPAGSKLIVVSASPSCCRALLNARAEIRRAGAALSASN